MTLVCRPDAQGGDGDVDGADLAVFSAAYGSDVGDADYLADTDFNANGYVDHDDLYTFARAFGRVDCLVCP